MPFQTDSFDRQVGLSNSTLTEQESNHIRARLRSRQNELRKIDVLINLRCTSNNTELLEDRSKLLTIIDRYRISLAPFKKLPPELLQHIFHYVFAGYDQVGPSIQIPPLVLCRICSTWRRTALKMPELWKSLHFTDETAYTPLQKVLAAQVWFSRAGNLGLALSLSNTTTPSSEIDFIKEIIIPFTRRFRYLHLVLNPCQIEAILALPQCSLDCLEELYAAAYVDPPSAYGRLPPPIKVFGPSACLRRIRLQLTPYVDYSLFTHLPWDRLQTFRCDSSLQCGDCHEMLRCCQTLEEIHVRIFAIRFSSPSNIEISLLNLRTLIVQLCDQESYDLFFLPLTIPVLKSLTIFHYHGLPWSTSMYNGLTERSRCAIEDLYLGTLDAEAAQVLSLLERTPSLRSITFSHNTTISDEVFLKIGRGDIGNSLEQLFLKGTRDLEDILSMLEMRQDNPRRAFGPPGENRPSSSLKFVQAHCNTVTATHEARIESLRGNGVEISLLPTEEGYFQL